jgi:hypothetical protein
MKKLFTLIAICLFGFASGVFAAGDKETIMDKEKAVWQTVQDKNLDAFRKYFANDFRSVYAEGIYTIDQEVDSVRKVDLKSFSISDSTVVTPDKDTALLTYKVTTQGTQAGKDMSGTWNCASVWHKSGAEWRVIFHTEVKAQAQ